MLCALSSCHSCSEHSRHWFFKGQLHVDGEKLPHSLFESIMSTQTSSNPNNILKFCDNSRLAMPWAKGGSGWREGRPWTLVGLAWLLEITDCVCSAIQGKDVRFLQPKDPTRPSCFQQQQGLRHVVFTAETHNFPTGEGVGSHCG